MNQALDLTSVVTPATATAPATDPGVIDLSPDDLDAVGGGGVGTGGAGPGGIT